MATTLVCQPATAAPVVTTVIDAADGVPYAAGWGIAVDPAGNLLVAGRDSDNLIRRTPGGTVSVLLDSSGDGVHALDEPTEVAAGADGSIYVVGLATLNVFRKPPAAAWIQILDASGDGAGHPLQYPVDLAVDGSGNVFVADSQGDYVLKVAAGTGAVSVVIDSSGDGAGHALDAPTALATDSDGNLYVAGAMTNNVFRVTPAGMITEFLASTPAAPFDAPSAVAVDDDGTLYVASTETLNLIRRDPDGTLTETETNLYAEDMTLGPAGIPIIASRNQHSIWGYRSDAPRCQVLDVSGSGNLPYDSTFRVASSPSGSIYAPGYTKVYRIDGACGAPADASGSWLMTLPDFPGESSIQRWSQSGFDLTVADSQTGDTFHGTIDDQGQFDLDGTDQICAEFPPMCCTSHFLGGRVSADGTQWDGALSYGAFNAHYQCSGYSVDAVATRCECDDLNEVSGDGCDELCRVEPCWQCEGGLPDVCSSAARNCISNSGAGGVSLKLDAAGNNPPSLQWRLKGGPSTVEALGDATGDTAWSLCLFDRSGPTPELIYATRAPAGSGWRASRSGFSLKVDAEEATQGVTQLSLRAGEQSKARLKAQGPNLLLPALPLVLPLTVQLQGSDAGCFESSYSPAGATTNDVDRVRAKPDPSSP